MPFMWVFQYIFQMFSPIVDIYMLIALFGGTQSVKLVVWYLVFLGIDMLSSVFAFGLEKEPLAPLLWMPLQRIVYRFLMVYIVLRSVFTALKGEAVGWNKLKRTGNAAQITTHRRFLTAHTRHIQPGYAHFLYHPQMAKFFEKRH